MKGTLVDTPESPDTREPGDTLLAIPDLGDAEELSCDVLVIGGGTAGTMAALTAAEHGADVLPLEKAHVRHSGALAMGMDGVNNAVIPGRAEPDDYVAEITRANDGIVDQSTVRQTATRGFAMVQRLESYGVKFEKDEHGEYAVRQVHRSGSYVLPMPEGKDVKKVLYRQLRRREMRERIRIENRVMPVRVLTSPEDGRAIGAAGFNTRTGRFVTVRAGSVILATGACGRLGLPASGYLYGTYENPTNAGDGYAMAYHAGAELTGIECFQINPLIKDYNGPACAVAVLTETAPVGTGPALAAALADTDGAVRAAAAASLRELVETLTPEPALHDPLTHALAQPDPVVRAAALDVLRALRLGDAGLFARSLGDPDISVRIEAVRALVSVDAAEALVRAADDTSREVRVTVAKALATVGADAGRRNVAVTTGAAATDADAGHRNLVVPSGSAAGPAPDATAADLVLAALDRLTEDTDALVRGAAFASLAGTGAPAPLAERAVRAQADPAWQVRAGAATALSVADAEVAVPALAKALADPNADVRKAAVLALVRHTQPTEFGEQGEHSEGGTGRRGTDGDVSPTSTATTVAAAREALATAATDSDADVRAYASRAL
ncbi:HEAT repeat protein [Streptomyces umbrinus]|uniref:HEAT repeat protein n=1 Tax=Streptomyces umbrinus TaxID=67370 RepID=A0ABU0T1E2_9ACTN|nr:HEAT repeat protein [Streptomyces umbrinus]